MNKYYSFYLCSIVIILHFNCYCLFAQTHPGLFSSENKPPKWEKQYALLRDTLNKLKTDDEKLTVLTHFVYSMTIWRYGDCQIDESNIFTVKAQDYYNPLAVDSISASCGFYVRFLNKLLQVFHYADRFSLSLVDNNNLGNSHIVSMAGIKERDSIRYVILDPAYGFVYADPLTGRLLDYIDLMDRLRNRPNAVKIVAPPPNLESRLIYCAHPANSLIGRMEINKFKRSALYQYKSFSTNNHLIIGFRNSPEHHFQHGFMKQYLAAIEAKGEKAWFHAGLLLPQMLYQYDTVLDPTKKTIFYKIQKTVCNQIGFQVVTN